MDAERALKILKPLAEGIDPFTGEILPSESLYQNPQVIRSLFVATTALEKQMECNRRQSNLPQNAGSKGRDITMNGSDSLLKTYDVTLSLLNNEVMLNWQRANISLLGHSILILAWATIYANHPQGKECLLAAILVFGVLLCVLWYGAALSGNTYHKEWLDWQYCLGNQLSNQPHARLLNIWDNHRKILNGEKITIHSESIKLSRFALGVKDYFTGLPILFTAIYFSLLLYLLWPLVCAFFGPPLCLNPYRIWVTIGLPVTALVIFFAYIYIRNWKWRCKKKKAEASDTDKGHEAGNRS